MARMAQRVLQGVPDVGIVVHDQQPSPPGAGAGGTAARSALMPHRKQVETETFLQGSCT